MTDSRLDRMKDRLERFEKEDTFPLDGDRTKKFAERELEHLCEELELEDETCNMARQVYSQCREEDFVRGRSLEAIVYASVYIACRLRDEPYTLQEIASHSRLNKDKIARTRKYIVNAFGYEITPVDPSIFVDDITDELGIQDDSLVKVSKKILEEAGDRGLISGKNPKGYAGAAVYLAAQELGVDINQSTVADIAGVSEVTIRHRYQEQEEMMEQEPIIG